MSAPPIALLDWLEEAGLRQCSDEGRVYMETFWGIKGQTDEDNEGDES